MVLKSNNFPLDNYKLSKTSSYLYGMIDEFAVLLFMHHVSLGCGWFAC